MGRVDPRRVPVAQGVHRHDVEPQVPRGLEGSHRRARRLTPHRDDATVPGNGGLSYVRRRADGGFADRWRRAGACDGARRDMIRGEGTAVARGVTPQEAFDFVLDPAQYTKADTKMVWVTKLGDTTDGMIAREDGRFLGRFPGSVITRYRWEAPNRIDVTLEHGVPQHLHAWFEIDEVDGGTRIHHVEEMDLGRGPLGWLYDRVGGQWFADSVVQEVDEIARLLEAGERGHGLAAHDDAGASQPR